MRGPSLAARSVEVCVILGPPGDACSNGPLHGQQAVVFRFDDPVALASARLHALAVQDLDSTPRVLNQTLLLQPHRCFAHALSANAQQVGDPFMGQQQFIAGRSVQGQQQEAAESVFDAVVSVADRGLRHLSDECLCVA